MSSITWSGSGTSTNPPQTNSDAFSIGGTLTYGATLTVTGTGGIIGTLNLQASLDGVTYVTTASVSVSVSSGSTAYSLSSQTTGLYLWARLNWVDS